MSQFIGTARHEFKMSIRRPGFWIAYVLLSLFYIISVLTPSMDRPGDVITLDKIWPEAGHLVFMYNIFMPILAGILSADRLQRDFRNGVRELQRSTSISIPVYILAKYMGVLASTLLPMFLVVIISGIALIMSDLAPLSIIWPLLLAFFSIAVPAHVFVVAFSLACPVVIPLRIYQVLFIGYWFWGNLLSPKAFPTISDTVLNAVGQYPLHAYFNMYFDMPNPADVVIYTRPEAVLNLFVLIACSTLALFTLGRYLHRQERNS